MVVVEQTEGPAGKRGRIGAGAPGLQQQEEAGELGPAQLVLLKVGQARVVVLQRRAAHSPVAAQEVLPLWKTHKQTTQINTHRTVRVSTPEKAQQSLSAPYQRFVTVPTLYPGHYNTKSWGETAKDRFN